MLDGADHGGTNEAVKMPRPRLRMIAKLAGKLAGKIGRAAATNRRDVLVTIFWNLSRAVIENVLDKAKVARLSPDPLSMLVAAQNSRGLIYIS